MNKQQYRMYDGKTINCVQYERMRFKCSTGGRCTICADILKNFESCLVSFSKRDIKKTVVVNGGLTIASDFNIWKSISKPDFFEHRVVQRYKGRREWTSELRTIYGDSSHGIVIKAIGTDIDKRTSLSNMYYDYIGQIEIVHVQMESEQGDATQSSVKEHNTIITEDTSVTQSISYAGQGPRLNLVSTEEAHNFDSIMNRWMPFSSHTVNISQPQGTEVAYYSIPEAFYVDSATPNLTQFRNFIFGELDIEIRIIVNAHRFQCGKLIACVFPDPYQGLATRRNFQNALQLPHVIIDLNGNNHGVLSIPFKYRRPVMRLVSNAASNKGVRGGVYGAFGIYTLAPLRTGPDQPTTCAMRTFFRFKKNALTGMSYQVTPQMDIRAQMEDVRGMCEGIGMTIKGVEKTLTRAGRLINWDKPQDVVNIIQTVPRPRLNFFTGVGISDAIQMRVSPYSTDVLPEELYRPDDPVSVHDIARIWGYHGVFSLNQTDTEGTPVYAWTIDPASAMTNFPPGSDASGLGVPSPFMFVNGLYNFWSGPIELRFDFVSNDFITGTVQVAFEPGRMSSTELQAQSTYTKTFHLGEQRSMTFTIPYINDTVMRRTGIQAFDMYPFLTPTTIAQDQANAVRMQPINSITMRIINPLRCAATTTSLIDVLVFMRAGSEYVNLSPVMSSWYVNSDASGVLSSFPGAFPTTIPVKSGSVSLPDVYNEVVPIFKSWSLATASAALLNERTPALLRPTRVPGEYLDLKGNKIEYEMPSRSVRAQMDNGEKEDLDPTLDFSQGPSRRQMVVTDKHDNIIDIMRRPVQLWSRVAIGNNAGFDMTTGSSALFYIPVMPPSHMWNPMPQGTPGAFLASVSKTPQASLASTFRHWRGSLRFTIIVYDTNAPVYVSYIPHNGTLYWGPQLVSKSGRLSQNIGPHSCGLTTEIIIPQVNPSITIEVPYECELDYLLTCEEARDRNYAWREKACYNNGHLVLWSVGATSPNAEIWVAAGDSFYLCDFIGTYRTRNRVNALLPSDNNPSPAMSQGFRQLNARKVSSIHRGRGVPQVILRAQMEEPGTSSGYYKQLESKIVGSRAFLPAAGILSGITGMNFIGPAAGFKAEQFAYQAKEQLDCISQTVKDAIAGFAQRLNTTIDIASLSTLALEIALDLVMLIRQFDYVSLLLTGFKIVVKIFGFSPGCIMVAFERISSWFGSSNTREQLSGLEPSDHSMVAMIVGLIGNMLGCVFKSSDVRSWAKTFALSFTETKGVAYMNQIFLFTRNYYGLLESVVRKALGMQDPYALAIESLKQVEDQIPGLLADIDTVTSGMNRNQRSLSSFRQRYWLCYMKALSLRKALLTLPKHQQNVQILRKCDEMIKHANENATTCSNSPVRYVPFVACLVGQPKIGKSYIVDEMASLFFEALGMESRTGNDIYIRNATAKHWDGLDGHSVILQDDIFNLNQSEFMNAVLADMYALKTTAQFIPEKAHLEEKGKTENPLLVLQTTNNAFPTSILENISLCPRAVLRRRDMVVEITLKAIYKSIDDVPEDILREKGHLTFQVYPDSTIKQMFDAPIMSWPEFSEFYKKTVRTYHEKELQSVKERMAHAMRRMGKHANMIDPHLDPSAFLHKLDLQVANDPTTTTGFLPSEILELEVERIRAATDAMADQALAIIPNQPIVEESERSLFMKLWALVTGGYIGFKAYHLLNDSQCLRCFERGIEGYTCTHGHFVCNECMTTDGKCPIESSNVECGAVLGFAFARKSLDVLKCVYEKSKQGVALLWERLVAGDPIVWSVVNCATYWTIKQYDNRPTMYKVSDDTGREWLVQAQSDGEGDCLIFSGGVPRLGLPTMSVDEKFAQYGISVTDMKIADHFLSFGRRSLGYFGKLEGKTADELCVHGPLRTHGDYISYDDGKWLVNVCGEMHYIPDDGKQCYECKLSLEEYTGLVQRWWSQNNEMLFRDFALGKLKVAKMKGKLPPYAIHSMITGQPLLHLPCEESTLMKLVKTIGLVAAAVGAMYGLYRTTKWLFDPKPLGQIEFSGDTTTRHFQRKTQAKNVQKLPSTQSDDFEECILMKLLANAACFRVKYSDGKSAQLAMTGLKERMAILPKHYVTALREKRALIEEIMVGRCNDEMSFHHYELDFKDFDISESSDISIFHMPQHQTMFKNIVKFIQTYDDLIKPMTNEGYMLRNPSSTVKNFLYVPLRFAGFKKRVGVRGTEDFVQHDVLMYNYSSDGACGSFVMKKRSQRPIVAMHFAGSGHGQSGTGYAILLSQEMMLDLKPRSLLQERIIPEVVKEPEDSKFLMPPHVQVEYIGEVSKAIFIPKKTKIKPSLIQEEIGAIYGTKTKPCFLSSLDPEYPHPHSPLVAGCMKHGKLTRDFSTSQLDEVQNYVFGSKMLTMQPSVVAPKLLTLEEAVTGFPGIDGYDAMKLDTSIGYPLNTQGVVSKNQDIKVEREGSEVKTVSISQRVQKMYDEDMSNRRNGIVPATVFTAFPKDERRAEKKRLKLGGTRIFLMSSVQYTLAKRQYYLHYTAAQMKNRSTMYSAVGIRCDSPEWGAMVSRLLTNGDNIFTLDYSDFGPAFNSGVNRRCLENAKNWLLRKVDLPEGSDVVLDSFSEEHANSMHIMSKMLMIQRCGGPSGDPGTVVHNGDVNFFYVCLAWLKIFGDCYEKKGVRYSDMWKTFEQNVVVIVYGDDLIASVSDEWRDEFNAATISAYFAQKNIVSTDASKAETVVAYGTIYDATFLKRGFKPHPYHVGEWLAPLEKQSIEEACQWVFSSENDEEATLQNAEASIRMAYGWGKEYFDEHALVVNTALANKGMQHISVSWDHIDRDFFPSYY
nr:MAG: polyprotein [Guiyang argiope bruennichi iflavirus 2]